MTTPIQRHTWQTLLSSLITLIICEAGILEVLK